jgi:hypothetical protein
MSLEIHKGKTPRTILDAMTIIRTSGERYLLVDCLCIIQDDEKHKSLQTARMAEIYSASSLTIVACTATNANSPLRR